jgi:hypothetical protein
MFPFSLIATSLHQYFYSTYTMSSGVGIGSVTLQDAVENEKFIYDCDNKTAIDFGINHDKPNGGFDLEIIGLHSGPSNRQSSHVGCF